MNIALSIVVGLFSLFAKGTHDPNDLLGKWKTQEGKVITITEKENVYTGQIVTGDKKIVDILQEFKFSNDQYKGTVNAVKRNMKLNGVIKMISEDKIELTVSKGFIEKSMEWKRIKP